MSSPPEARRRAKPGRVGAAVALLIAWAAVASCGRERGEAPPERWRPGRGRFLVGGIQIDEPDRERWLGSLERAGLNTVALTVYARQQEWDGAELDFGSEPESWVVDEARAARARGLHVVLVLRVALDSAPPPNRFLWHGLILPRDQATLAAWFARYREYALHWAAIAERAGVDVLGIGSELNTLASTRETAALPELEAYYLDPAKQRELRARVTRFEAELEPRHLEGGWQETYDSVEAWIDAQIEAHRRWAEAATGWSEAGGDQGAVALVNRRRRLLLRHWEALIAELRSVFHGELTYAANFDQYREVGFWPALDLVGINAYFPLRQDPLGDREVAAVEPEMEGSWRRILGEIDAFRSEAGIGDRAVLFTELGYTRWADSTLEPWSSRGFSLVGEWDDPELVIWDRSAQRPEERAAAVRALRRAAAELPGLLSGVLWWKLSTVASHDAIEPFVLLIGDGAPADPLAPELRALATAGAGQGAR